MFVLYVCLQTHPYRYATISVSLKHISQEPFVSLVCDFQLHGVIARGESLNVPVQLHKLAAAFEIVQHDQVHTDQQHGATGYDRGFSVLFVQTVL